MKLYLFHLLLTVWGLPLKAQSQVDQTFKLAFESCSRKSDANERLACFDGLSSKEAEASEEPVGFSLEASSAKSSLQRMPPPREKSSLRDIPRGLTSDGPNVLGISNAQKFSGRGDRGEQNHVEFALSL